MRGVISIDVEGDFGTERLRGVDEILPELLDGFESRGVRVVLFAVGNVARERPGLLRAAADRGHAVASHSMTHAQLARIDPARRRAEIVDSRAAIEDVTGQACVGFRAPFFDVPDDLGPLLEDAGYRWSSSKSPFSGIAHYRWFRDTAGPHRLAGSHVVELPVGRVLGAPMPEGLSYHRAFWPLTALSRTPPAMFYLHPYELLDEVESFGLPSWWRVFVTRGQGAWARRHLWHLLDAWTRAGAVYGPPTEEMLACVT